MKNKTLLYSLGAILIIVIVTLIFSYSNGDFLPIIGESKYQKFINYIDKYDDLVIDTYNKKMFNGINNIVDLGDYLIYVETDSKEIKSKILAYDKSNNEIILLFEDKSLIAGLSYIDKNSLLFSVINNFYPDNVARNYYKLNLRNLKKEKMEVFDNISNYFSYNKEFYSSRFDNVDYYNIYKYNNNSSIQILSKLRSYNFYNNQIYYTKASDNDNEETRYDLFVSDLNGENERLLNHKITGYFNIYDNGLYHIEDKKLIFINLIDDYKMEVDLSMFNIKHIDYHPISSYNIIENDILYLYFYDTLYIIDITSNELIYDIKLNATSMLKYNNILFIQSWYLKNPENGHTLDEYKIKLNKLDLDNYKLETID